MDQSLRNLKRDACEFIVNDAIRNVEGLISTIDDMFSYAMKEIDNEEAKRPLIEMYAKARFHADSCKSIIDVFVIDEHSDLNYE